MIGDALEMAGIAFLEFQIGEARLCGAFIAGLDQVPGDVDADDFGTLLGERQGRRAVAAAKVQDADRRLDAKRIDQCFARLAHRCGNGGEVALLP